MGNCRLDSNGKCRKSFFVRRSPRSLRNGISRSRCNHHLLCWDGLLSIKSTQKLLFHQMTKTVNEMNSERMFLWELIWEQVREWGFPKKKIFMIGWSSQKLLSDAFPPSLWFSLINKLMPGRCYELSRWTFFFGSKMSLNLGHFEPRVLWKWVARVVAWGVRVSAYFACTSHVLYMPTHLCPRVEGGSGGQ